MDTVAGVFPVNKNSAPDVNICNPLSGFISTISVRFLADIVTNIPSSSSPSSVKKSKNDPALDAKTL